MMVFDFNFTNESSFMFDPDADNWRRKTVGAAKECCTEMPPAIPYEPLDEAELVSNCPNTAPLPKINSLLCARLHVILLEDVKTMSLTMMS